LLFALQAHDAMRYHAHHGELCDAVAKTSCDMHEAHRVSRWAAFITYMVRFWR